MNRRVFLSGLGACAAGLALRATFSEAFSQGQTFSRIVVDTKPLQARGGGAAASIIGPRLQASLQRELSGRIGRGGALLTARVHSVQLSSYTRR